MRELVDAKALLEEEALLSILALCNYKPTPEKISALAGTYSADAAIEAYACRDEDTFTGLIVLSPMEENAVEIRSIAVLEAARRGGVGRALIEYARNLHPDKDLVAETDDDAVGFYHSCGFIAREIDRFPDVRRYRCILSAETNTKTSLKY